MVDCRPHLPGASGPERSLGANAPARHGACSPHLVAVVSCPV